MHAIAGVTSGRAAARNLIVLAGQQEVVHTADAACRIPHARGDAGAEDRRQHRLGVVFNVVFTLHDMNAHRARRIRLAVAHARCIEA
jgi:hypothetical protein